jgi:hypothetical protein
VLYQATCAVQNLNTIFDGLRSTGYDGLIVALTYYALDYRDTSGALLLNSAMLTAAKGRAGVLVASGFDAWMEPSKAANGDTCAAGLRIKGGRRHHRRELPGFGTGLSQPPPALTELVYQFRQAASA